jgi:hypothetical protein
LGNTFYFVIVGVPVSIGLSLCAALLLDSRFAHWQSFFRTSLFAPVVTTAVAVAVIWRYLLHTRYGLVNQGLAAIGLAPIDWLGDPALVDAGDHRLRRLEELRLQHDHSPGLRCRPCRVSSTRRREWMAPARCAASPT